MEAADGSAPPATTSVAAAAAIMIVRLMLRLVVADASRRHNPWAADVYQRGRDRGASHAHASRILGRAWSQVIWRLWHDHDTYDPQQHTALQRLIAAAA